MALLCSMWCQLGSLLCWSVGLSAGLSGPWCPDLRSGYQPWCLDLSLWSFSPWTLSFSWRLAWLIHKGWQRQLWVSSFTARAYKPYYVTSTIFYYLNKSWDQPRVKGWRNRFLMGGATKNLHPHLMYHLRALIGYIDTVIYYIISCTWFLCLKCVTV